MIFVKESIVHGLHWVVFEPNNETLWAKALQVISSFMRPLWREGALMGRAIEDAYFVHCGRDTMMQDDIDNRRLIRR